MLSLQITDQKWPRSSLLTHYCDRALYIILPIHAPINDTPSQSKHRCLYTTSVSPHPSLHQCTTQEMSVDRQSGGPSWCTHPPHFALRLLLQWQLGLAVPNFVYPMHFTHYSLQWRLTKLKTKYSQFLLKDSST